MDIILASTSPYRRALLQRLQLPFNCVDPQTEEKAVAGEAPADMAKRLALAKARAVATRFPDALVIGSDQVASIDERIMGKPGNHEAALDQLRASSGREVLFHTAVALISIAGHQEQFHVEPFSAHFRELDENALNNYLRREQPYDCAGSFKCEGLGIALFDKLQGRDPTSLEGLPLIALSGMLATAGVDVLSSP